METKDYSKLNTVSSKDQLEEHEFVKIVRREDSALKVLFVGNSITRHRPKDDIGWFWDWGMAASCEEKDYVHRVVAMLEEKHGPVDYCVAQLATWERDYPHTEEIMEQYYTSARDFGADLIIIRIGENIRDDDHKKVNCKPYFDKMIRYFIKDEHTAVVVTDNFWKRKIVEEYGKSIDDEIRDLAAERGYIFCKLNDLSKDERTMALGLFEHHGVSIHPGDYGMEMIAKRIVEVVPDIK